MLENCKIFIEKGTLRDYFGSSLRWKFLKSYISDIYAKVKADFKLDIDDSNFS